MLKKSNLDVLIVELLLFDELELFDGLALDHGDAIFLHNLAILRFLDHVLKREKKSFSRVDNDQQDEELDAG